MKEGDDRKPGVSPVGRAMSQGKPPGGTSQKPHYPNPETVFGERGLAYLGAEALCHVHMEVPRNG
jgi:hypothetical protein